MFVPWFMGSSLPAGIRSSPVWQHDRPMARRLFSRGGRRRWLPAHLSLLFMCSTARRRSIVRYCVERPLQPRRYPHQRRPDLVSGGVFVVATTLIGTPRAHTFFIHCATLTCSFRAQRRSLPRGLDAGRALATSTIVPGGAISCNISISTPLRPDVRRRDSVLCNVRTQLVRPRLEGNRDRARIRVSMVASICQRRMFRFSSVRTDCASHSTLAIAECGQRQSHTHPARGRFLAARLYLSRLVHNRWPPSARSRFRCSSRQRQGFPSEGASAST